MPKRKRVNCEVPMNYYQWLNSQAVDRDMSMKDVVCELIREAMRRRDTNSAPNRRQGEWFQ